jgi:hypothetical protein
MKIFSIFLIFTILLYSNSFAQIQKNIKLIKFVPSQCDRNEDALRISTRIVNQGYDNDIFKIEVGTIATCCVDFIPSINYKKDTLFLGFEQTGNACMCMCCYQFIYHIKGLKGKTFVVKLQNKVVKLSLEKYITYPIKFKITNKDTINFIDKYGFKQGLHISDDTLRQYSKNIHYLNNMPYNGKLSMTYYINGTKKSETIVTNGKHKKVDYYKNGKIQQECQDFKIKLTKNSSTYINLCNSWDSLGQQLTSMNSCLLKDTTEYFTRIYAFKSDNTIYINNQYSLEEKEWQRIEQIKVDIHKKALFCYQKGTNITLVAKIIEYLTKKGILYVDINEF